MNEFPFSLCFVRVSVCCCLIFDGIKLPMREGKHTKNWWFGSGVIDISNVAIRSKNKQVFGIDSLRKCNIVVLFFAFKSNRCATNSTACFLFFPSSFTLIPCSMKFLSFLISFSLLIFIGLLLPPSTSCLALHLKSLYSLSLGYSHIFSLEFNWRRFQRIVCFMKQFVAGVSQTCATVDCCPLPFVGWNEIEKSRKSRQESTKHTSNCKLKSSHCAIVGRKKGNETKARSKVVN